MRYDPDYHGLDELINGPELTAILRTKAEAIRDWVEANSPIGTPPQDPHPGAFRASVTVTPARSFRGTRPRFDVSAHVPYKDEVEQQHHVMERALDIARAG